MMSGRFVNPLTKELLAIAVLSFCSVAAFGPIATIKTMSPSTIENLSSRPSHVANVQLFAASDDLSQLPVAENNHNIERMMLWVWLVAISGFVATNYARETIWPLSFLLIPYPFWSLIHGLSAMVFAGGIVTTTLLEWTLPSIMESINEKDNNESSESKSMLLLTWLWQVESRLVLPAVTGSLISGVAQAFYTYPSLHAAPQHIKSVLHLMVLFGMWWAWTDRRSQNALRSDGFDTSKVLERRLSNLVSCAFLVVIYGVMILKPGFN